jgi:hypothetical protein
MAQAYNVLPPAQDLWELFDYKPLTGELVRRVRTSNKPAGSVAGCLDSTCGYFRIRIKKRHYKLHRVVWCWVTGTDPGNLDIDHVDRNPSNNTWQNLRPATRAQNAGNQKSRGWDFDKRTGKYQARIRHNYKCISLGAYNTAEEATAAYQKAVRELRKDFSPV